MLLILPTVLLRDAQNFCLIMPKVNSDFAQIIPYCPYMGGQLPFVLWFLAMLATIKLWLNDK